MEEAGATWDEEAALQIPSFEELDALLDVNYDPPMTEPDPMSRLIRVIESLDPAYAESYFESRLVALTDGSQNALERDLADTLLMALQKFSGLQSFALKHRGTLLKLAEPTHHLGLETRVFFILGSAKQMPPTNEPWSQLSWEREGTIVAILHGILQTEGLAALLNWVFVHTTSPAVNEIFERSMMPHLFKRYPDFPALLLDHIQKLEVQGETVQAERFKTRLAAFGAKTSLF